MTSRPRRVESASDPELRPFVDLVESRTNDVIVEGELAVSRALASGWPVHTVVTTPGRTPALADRVGPTTRWLEVPPDLLQSVTGFAFHRGVLAAGDRPPSTGRPGASVLRALERSARPTVVMAENLADPSNLGALIRNAAALGADLVVTGARGCDPFSRRSIRASAGLVFSHPVVVSPDLAATLRGLREALPELRVMATSLEPSATPLVDVVRTGPVLVMFGNEGAGLSDGLRELADECVRIEMAEGVDSLNVAAASAVVLWALQRMVGSAR